MSRLLDVYLQDHHAGATTGLELARRVSRANRASVYAVELESLASEIEEDVLSLERIMSELGVERDRRKDAAGWVGEKLGRLKRNGTWVAYSPLSRLVELEGLVIGVRGKQGLWEALADAPAAASVSAEVELLADRARDQLSRLEALRRRAAREALS
jgi:hypothetical protein